VVISCKGVASGCSQASILASRREQNHGVLLNQLRQQAALPLSELQRRQAGTRLDRSVLPPLALGLTWSRVREAVGGASPQ
jgi:hypothetical protein